MYDRMVGSYILLDLPRRRKWRVVLTVEEDDVYDVYDVYSVVKL
jgi:hypothetical protein